MADNSTRVTPQGGILEGSNPTVWDSKNPIVLFVIQATIIIALCRALQWPLSKIRQPTVIAEVIGGILLGPSVCGHIPGFTAAIFPSESLPILNLVANLGLLLFLFLVGLETDLRFLISNWRIALSVSAAGMILPFGLGCAVAYGLYHQFRSDPALVPIGFPIYMLFVGIAMAITAFPVLCRILTELKLLTTQVGVIVLSAGVGNDVVGWILLALCVALVNAGTGLVALWVLLISVAYIIFLSVAIRPVFLWYLRRTGSLEKGPSQSVVAVTLLLALASAFFTQVIGIHAIFGGFVVGLICPHEGGFAIKLTEKIEDLVTVLFLPLYFALSGLQTNVGLLDSGIAWGYVVGIIAIALIAKITGGALASRWAGLLWRESFTVGVLMSCKGLVELIVLNIGRQARILSDRTFTMFVIMALVTTFLTTPLTSWLYPKWYQDKVDRWRRGETDWDGNPLRRSSSPEGSVTASEKLRGKPVQKIAVYLRLDSLSSLCTFVSLLGTGRSGSPPAPGVHYSKKGEQAAATGDSAEEQRGSLEPPSQSSLQIHGIRLMELTDRLSSTMKVSEIEEYSVWDPVVNVFRSFGQLNNVWTGGRAAVVPEYLFSDSVVDMARDTSADLLLVPWSASGSMSDRQSLWSTEESLRLGNKPYPAFVSDILSRVTTDVGILVDRTLDVTRKERPTPKRSASARSLPVIRTNVLDPPAGNRNQHILFLFFGGPDDRFALRFVLQLAQNKLVTATIVHIDVPESVLGNFKTAVPASSVPTTPGPSTAPPPTDIPPSLYPNKDQDTAFFASIRDSLPDALSSRVVFRTQSSTADSANPLDLAFAAAQDETSLVRGEPIDRIVVVGRRSVGGEPTSADPSGEPDTRKALGVVGEALLRRGVKASVLVLHNGGREASAGGVEEMKYQ